MVKNDVAVKNSAGTAAADRPRQIVAATPGEGARLIRAFVAVKNPRVRKAIVAFVENLS